MRVLFVDDNMLNRRVVKEMLCAGGIQMDEADGGEAGLRMIEANDYDLVLMDLRMPGMDGKMAIRQLRARGDRKAGVPVIVVTADAGPTVEAECRAAGADDLILKPISIASLFKGVEALLGRRTPGMARVA